MRSYGIELHPAAPGECFDEGSVAPALAEALRGWFPEFGGRVLAVSEVEITKENIPTAFPLGLVSPIDDTSDHNPRTGKPVEITENVLVSFMFAPERYPRRGGGDSGLWKFYDIHPLRTRLIAGLRMWTGPNGARVAYRSGRIATNEHAVAAEFVLECSFVWAPPKPEAACVPEPPCVMRVSVGPGNRLVPTDIPEEEPPPCP